MLFDRCQYKFARTVNGGLVDPGNEKMLLGTKYHALRDTLLKDIDVDKFTDDFNTNYSYIRSLLPDTQDMVLDSIAKMEAERSISVPNNLFKPFLSEQNFRTIFCDRKYINDYMGEQTAELTEILSEADIKTLQEKYNVDIVLNLKGTPDNLYLDADGTYVPYEFKTGTFNTSTATKIRKELIYYSILMKPHLDLPITNIAYGYVNADKNEKEPIKTRSVKALKDLIFKVVIALQDNKFDQKFYYEACKNCFLCKECELMASIRR